MKPGCATISQGYLHAGGQEDDLAAFGDVLQGRPGPRRQGKAASSGAVPDSAAKLRLLASGGDARRSEESCLIAPPAHPTRRSPERGHHLLTFQGFPRLAAAVRHAPVEIDSGLSGLPAALMPTANPADSNE